MLIGILSSIIGSVLILFSAKLIERKAHQIINWISSKNKKYSDKFYNSIARNKNYNLEFLTAIMVLTIFLYGITNIVANYNDNYKIVKKIINDYPNLNQLNSTKFLEIKNTYEQEQKFERFKFVKRNFWIFKITKYFTIVFGIILIFGFLEAMFRSRLVKQCNRTFIRYLDIISPYVTPKEILVLRSNWATMTSREDYVRIREKIINHLKSIDQGNKVTPDETIEDELCYEIL